MPFAIKNGRVETFNEKLRPIKSHDPLIKQSCDVT